MRALCIAILIASPAQADCQAQVQALFAVGGPNDPFARPPHVQVQVVYGADGAETSRFDNKVETPLRTIGGVGGQCTLVVETDYWVGPCFDGPWTKQTGNLPADREATIRADLGAEGRNLRDAECLGPVEIDGETLSGYRWRTQTDPDQNGGVRGGLYTVYLDPVTRDWRRWEVREAVSPWAPEPSTDTVITTVTYDDSISISAPEG